MPSSGRRVRGGPLDRGDDPVRRPAPDLRGRGPDHRRQRHRQERELARAHRPRPQVHFRRRRPGPEGRPGQALRAKPRPSAGTSWRSAAWGSSTSGRSSGRGPSCPGIPDRPDHPAQEMAARAGARPAGPQAPRGRGHPGGKGAPGLHPRRAGPEHRHPDRGRLQGPSPEEEGLPRAARDHEEARPGPVLRRLHGRAAQRQPVPDRHRPVGVGEDRRQPLPGGPRATTASTTSRPSSSRASSTSGRRGRSRSSGSP